MRRRPSPAAAAQQAVAQARAQLRREQALNTAILRIDPGRPSTERYDRGPLPSSSPVFYTTADFIRYEARREQGRFDPFVRYPAPPRRRG